MRDLLTQENLSEDQKLEHLINLGLVPLREYYNKEILKHNRICFKNLELRKKEIEFLMKKKRFIEKLVN